MKKASQENCINKGKGKGESEVETKSFSLSSLPIYNIVQRPYRTIGLIVLAALMAFVIFAGSVLTISLKNGLDCLKTRFGADLIVIPEENNSQFEGILLKGEPSYFYMDKSYVEQIAKINGVAQASPQFYLASTGNDCCDVAVQIIGFDSETDFSVQPWINEVYKGELTEGAVIVGSDISIAEDETITFFGRSHPIAAQLAKTGTGLDSAAFAATATIIEMMNDSVEKGFNFIGSDNPNNIVSSVLIKAEAGYDLAQIKRDILYNIKGVKVVEKQNVMTDISDNIKSFSSLMYIFAVMFLVLAVITLNIVFSVSTNERKKELALLRTIGFTRKRLAGLLHKESFLICAIGWLIGAIVAAVVVFPFSTAIEVGFGMPYLSPSALQILLVLIISMLITIGAGTLASAYSALRISYLQIGFLLKEGE
jgi:putative ABC transport system permease protein